MNDGLFQSELAAMIQPRVLIKPESWLSKIEFINHMILFNNILVTILSEKEGGKTCFTQVLQEHLDAQINLLSIIAKVPCTREEIIQEIATKFHLKHDEHTDISSLVAQINERNTHVLLMIDEAQHLPETFIKEVLLSIKNEDNFNFFHLCLVSDYSIMATLNGLTSSFFEGLVHNIEVGALTESEARTYVLQRAMAKRLINKPLSDAQLKNFYQQTRGNIANINNTLEAFIFNCTVKKVKNPFELVRKIAVPVSAAILSGAACLFIAKSFYLEPELSTTAPAVVAQKQPEILVSSIASWQDSARRELVEHSLAARQDLDILAKNTAQNAVAIARHAVKPVKIKSATRVAARKRTMVKTQEALLYTIQLVASPDKIDMERYRKINKMAAGTAKLAHYHEHHTRWYVLTMGEFTNLTDAQQKIKELPPGLMKLNPWVRPIKTLG